MFKNDLDQRYQEHLKAITPTQDQIEAKNAHVEKEAQNVWERVKNLFLKHISNYTYHYLFIGYEKNSRALYYSFECSDINHTSDSELQDDYIRCYPLHYRPKYPSETLALVADTAQKEGLQCRYVHARHAQISAFQVFDFSEVIGYKITYAALPDRDPCSV